MVKFKDEYNNELRGLLEYWRTIEFWIKKAEQVNQEAVISAINELRYASRQLLYCANLLNLEKTNAGIESSVRKRLVIAEQYLKNADHDVADSIIGYYSLIVREIELGANAPEIARHFNKYPLMRQKLRDAEKIIGESRRHDENRIDGYQKLRKDHLPFLIEIFDEFVDAQVLAKKSEEEFQRKLKIYQSKNTFFKWFGIISGLASIVALGLAIYKW